MTSIAGAWPVLVGALAVVALVVAWWATRSARATVASPPASAPVRDFTVLAVGSDDAYLNHVLRIHDVDIHEHQPDFAWYPTRTDLQAYLVQEGDQTVGVVVLRARGDVAHVELDWVTPAFRDCAAGEYVWLRSDILRNRGIRRVITPANMKNPYYPRLGFRRLGESYALDLPPTLPAPVVPPPPRPLPEPPAAEPAA
ncbi:hypothetical protein [Nocardioides zeae]|uniref:N-acetyltransferase domain-containing protein n=1 Tax=Nocardioides zeae TaxID=1457234 RepID=A0A6P0HN58_9ACTN|nr:hypothetical protein [Nocardioides zeae]NEN79657.1 hypothetical protein [Nocardioides zeae]